MAKQKEEKLNGILASEDILAPVKNMKEVDEYAIEPTETKQDVVETLKEEKKEEPKVVEVYNKRTGVVLGYIGNETIIATDKGNIHVSGRIGKKGRTVEY